MRKPPVLLISVLGNLIENAIDAIDGVEGHGSA